MKKYSILSAIIVFCVIFIPKATAASYYSTTLSLPDNGTVNGLFRNYKTGDHILDMSIDSYYTTCSANVNQTRISLINDTRTLKDIVIQTKTGTSLYKNFGNYYAGSKKYVFSSNVYYVPYCGIISNNVKLYPKA